MKKRLTFMTLLLVVLSNVIYPLQVVFGTSSSDLIEIKERNRVSEDRASFQIGLLKPGTVDTLNIELPEFSTVDEDEMDNQAQDYQWEYDEEQNKVMVHNISEDITEVTVSLKNISTGQHVLSVIPLYEGQEAEKVVHSFETMSVIEETQEEATEIEAEKQESIIKQEELPVHNETASELQRDLKIQRVDDDPIVEAGTDALFKLILKTTGSQVKYNESKINIQLPDLNTVQFKQDLNELKIAGVVPKYDSSSQILSYEFDELKSGQTYERIIKLGTENGTSIPGTVIPVKSELLLKHEGQLIKQTDTVTKKIGASQSVTLQKTLLKTGVIPQPGGTVYWEIKVNIPKKETGQMYIKPKTKIKINDTLPNGLTFVKSLDPNITPVKSGQNLTWTFDAPSISEQKKMNDSLFTQTIIIETKISNDKKYIGILTNKASIEGTFIDDILLKPATETKADVLVSESKPSTGNIVGSIFTPTHVGPNDNKGNTVGGTNNLDPNISTTDDGYLLFVHGVNGYRYALHHDLKKFIVHYKIDDNLILDKLTTPGGTTEQRKWVYGRTPSELKQQIPLPVEPKYDLVVNFIDSNGKQFRKVIKDPIHGKQMNRNDLGLVSSDRVTEIRYEFKDRIPMGLFSVGHAMYWFNIKKGYVGIVENEFNMTGETTYNRLKPGEQQTTDILGYTPNQYRAFNYKVNFPQNYSGKTDISGDRHAKIVPKPKETPPVGSIHIKLLDDKNNVVQVGDNRMRILFKNNPASSESIIKDLESVVLLPPGVTLNPEKNELFRDNDNNVTTGTTSIITDDYNGTGRQLVRIKWDEEKIRVGKNISVDIDIDISEHAPNTLLFDVYGYSGNKLLGVPSTSGESVTSTSLQTNNLDDLNGDGKKDALRLKSGNIYKLTGTYDLQAEKFVRSSTTDEWGSLKKVTPGKEFSYKLHMTNTTGKDISNMTLIDVLPSVGDLGITDNISRGSKFTPSLKGPISLPKEWVGKVNVFYSTATNPKRDDLIRDTKYPYGVKKLSNPSGATDPNWMSESKVIDWSSIHSFKVELLPGITWIKGVDMDITYDMLAPKVEDIEDMSIFDGSEDVTKRAAYNSFAIATDSGQPVEPFQVGVYMDLDGSLSITKIDSEKTATGDVKKLSGAEFELYNDKDQLITTLITDTEGAATIKGLPLGEYTLKETKAPEGYNVLKKPISVSITNKESQVELTIKNTKQGWHLPNTGGIGTALFYGVGLAMMGIGGYLVLQKKRNKKLDMSEQ